MYTTNQWYAEAAAEARLRGSESTVFLDILTARLHAHMHYSAARMAAEKKAEAAYKVLIASQETVCVGEFATTTTEVPPKQEPKEVKEYDDETVKWFIRLKGLRREDDDGPVTPPEYRLFNNQYPSYLREQERRKLEREESERRSVESRLAAQKAAEHTRLMREMREWGRENGFFVGTRGRIPRAVIEAYNEAKGTA